MALIDSPWLNVVAATMGGLAFGLGVGSLYGGFSLWGAFWAVFGFLVLGWAFFDRRRHQKGTPEGEGRTIE